VGGEEPGNVPTMGRSTCRDPGLNQKRCGGFHAGMGEARLEMGEIRQEEVRVVVSVADLQLRGTEKQKGRAGRGRGRDGASGPFLSLCRSCWR
jgi:hypothetical protein